MCIIGRIQVHLKKNGDSFAFFNFFQYQDLNPSYTPSLYPCPPRFKILRQNLIKSQLPRLGFTLQSPCLSHMLVYTLKNQPPALPATQERAISVLPQCSINTACLYAKSFRQFLLVIQIMKLYIKTCPVFIHLPNSVSWGPVMHQESRIQGHLPIEEMRTGRNELGSGNRGSEADKARIE